MSLNKLRRQLYRSARLLGDVQAVRTGTVGQRVARKAGYRIMGRLMSRLFKW